MAVKNKVQLIAYPDSLGGNLKALHAFLAESLPGVFQGGVHILPPFPSSGDRGFAPLSYLEIEKRFGDWADIRAIGEEHDVLIDLMVNHISRRSHYFQNFLEEGRSSKYADLFLTLDKVWPDGQPVQADVDRMFLRRTVPWSTFAIGRDGLEERVWTTFGRSDPSEQIDLDIESETTRQLLIDFFQNFSRNGVKIVRLDAVGYVIKKPGTSCFFVEPEIYGFLDWMRNLADSMGIALLPEIHASYEIQFRLSARGFWIYDFILPYRILEALTMKKGKELKTYLAHRPAKQFTMLDCHDGIPVKPDLDGLADSREARELVHLCLARGANLSRIVSEKHKDADGFDIHQIRGTIYSLLGENDDVYLSARAIQFFTPGIPQVYYVGLLAGENDTEAVRRTGEGRELNRHNYTKDEMMEALQKDVVQRLIRLIRFRNSHPAFDGIFEVEPSKEQEICLKWTLENHFCRLSVDLGTGKADIGYSDEYGNACFYTV